MGYNIGGVGMVKLRAIKYYEGYDMRYWTGQVLELTEGDALFLLSDSPASFEVLKESELVRALKEAPRSEAVEGA